MHLYSSCFPEKGLPASSLPAWHCDFFFKVVTLLQSAVSQSPCLRRLLAARVPGHSLCQAKDQALRTK